MCLQVNFDNEPNKAGIDVKILPELAMQVANLPDLKLRGLMAIPPQEMNSRPNGDFSHHSPKTAGITIAECKSRYSFHGDVGRF